MRRTGLLHRLVYGSSAKLRTYEEAVLQFALDQLREPQAEKLKEQIRQLPYRQRHSDDRVLAFFGDRPGELPSVLFENRSDDLIMAEMDVVPAAATPTEKRCHATLYCANGCFYSIEFSTSPGAVGLAEGVAVQIENFSVNTLFDSPS